MYGHPSVGKEALGVRDGGGGRRCRDFKRVALRYLSDLCRLTCSFVVLAPWDGCGRVGFSSSSSIRIMPKGTRCVASSQEFFINISS